MVYQWLTAVVALMVIMAGWLGVQHLYRLFAEKNADCGPFREDGGNTTCQCCASRHTCQGN